MLKIINKSGKCRFNDWYAKSIEKNRLLKLAIDEVIG